MSTSSCVNIEHISKELMSLRASSGITYIACLPKVLYMDFNGYFAPLKFLFYSSTLNSIISKHPESCVEEICAMYCPQCVSRFHVDEVKISRSCCPHCFNCPRCESTLIVENFDDEKMRMSCGYCLWKSDTCQIIGSSKSDLERIYRLKESRETDGNYTAFFNELLEKFGDDETFGYDRFRLNESSSRTLGSIEDLKASILVDLKESRDDSSVLTAEFSSMLTGYGQRLFSNGKEILLVNDLIPTRETLLSKKTLRSRNHAKTRLSILCQPKSLPLEVVCKDYLSLSYYCIHMSISISVRETVLNLSRKGDGG